MVKRGFARLANLESVMPKVNLDLQLKFLSELESALTDALGRYADESDEKLAELAYMQKEVRRAKRVISERIDSDDKPRRRYQPEGYQEVAFS